MTDGPLVSIVIPCHNAEKHVAEAVRSALAQTYRPVEVVVVDDGSTDGSVEVLKSFGDAIRWETGPNRGACAARNRGAAIARGDLLLFLDADDVLDPRKVEAHVEAFARHPASTATMAHYDIEDGGRRTTCRLDFRDGDFLAFCLRRTVQTSCMVHRRAAFEAVGGFAEGLPAAQEFDLHLRLAAAGAQVAAIDESLHVIRKVPGGISRDASKVYLQFAPILGAVAGRIESARAMTEERRMAFAEALVVAAGALLAGDREREARECLAMAESFHASRGIGAIGGLAGKFAKVAGPMPALKLRRFLRERAAR